MIRKIENNEFDDVKKSRYALVDFSATWCGPCRMLAPVLEELSEDMKDKVTFFSADVDENTDLAEKFGITSIPALILFKDGKKTDMQIGFQPKDGIRSWIQSRL